MFINSKAIAQLAYSINYRDQYTQKLPVLNGSSIGQHVRHAIKFFQCLFEELSTIIINSDPYFPIQLKVNFDDDNFELIETNFLRELVYMVEHSIHHFALMQIGIQENVKHIKIESNFGVAYSTISHQQKQHVFFKRPQRW